MKRHEQDNNILLNQGEWFFSRFHSPFLKDDYEIRKDGTLQ